MPSRRPTSAQALPEARPTREQALDAFCVLLAFVAGGSTSSSASYDANTLPPGVTRDAYLRRHRERLRAGVPGWTKAGAGRVVTRQAWELDVSTETTTARARPKRTPPNAPPPPPANDVSAQLDAALGIRTGGGRR